LQSLTCTLKQRSLKPKNWYFWHFFWIPANKNFENRQLQNVDAISSTGESFTKHNLVFFKIVQDIFSV